MFTILAILHIIVCVFLILVVLLQTGKGSDIGAVFGGGGTQALFGSAGPSGFLGKMTAVVAVIFMFTSLTLAARVFKQAPSSIMEETLPKAGQAAPAKVPQEEPTTPTPADQEKTSKKP
jgi:preprotein translocase subunit SecG